ncbi:hypothetical protein OJ998_01020 [Solirubrobacter taibaiensis]|nr:hypothetical protein [Solirubrobacter taibaiensis]
MPSSRRGCVGIRPGKGVHDPLSPVTVIAIVSGSTTCWPQFVCV